MVKEFCYLGYTLQKNGRQETHVKEKIRKAAAVMEQVWGKGGLEEIGGKTMNI